MLACLDCYREQLFGHPLAHDGEGRIAAVVERTNNPAEHFFAQAKRQLRRRLGRAHLGRDLCHPDDVRILCGTLDALPRAFSELVRSGQATVRPALDRYARNCDLRRRVKQWSAQSGNAATPARPTSASPS